LAADRALRDLINRKLRPREVLKLEKARLRIRPPEIMKIANMTVTGDQIEQMIAVGKEGETAQPTMIPESLVERLRVIGCAARFCLVARLDNKPFEDGWNKPQNLMTADNARLQDWLKQGGNYGVAAGDGLVIFDADNDDGRRIQETRLPATFTVRTPGGGYHAYYHCEDMADAKIRLRDKEGIHIGDVQGVGRMCTGPNSIRRDGAYRIVADVPIAKVTVAALRQALGEYAVPEKEIQHTLENARKDADKGLDFFIMKLFTDAAVEKFKRQGEELYGAHPVHGSETGRNFWIDVEKNVWHCFRHGVGGGELQLLAVLEGILPCEEAGKASLKGERFKQTVARAVELGLIDPAKVKGVKGIGPVHVPTPAVVTDRFIAEEVWDRKDPPRFCVYTFETAQFTYQDQIDVGERTGDKRKILYVPLQTPALFKAQVLLPRGPVASTFDEVYREGCELAFQFYDCEPEKIPEVKLLVAIAEADWFLDRFLEDPTQPLPAGMGCFAPIVALRGPSGSGKSRLVAALRLLLPRVYYDQSTRRIPSLFRPMDQWRGALVMDECDFRYSDETSDLTHYLNCRCYGVPISRQNPNDPSKSESFHNFGLTVVTQRRPWVDNATEDRSIPFYCERTKKAVPTAELDEWIRRGLDLQDKLLYLRMTLYRKIRIDKTARVPGVREHRLTAAILPVLALEPYAPEMVADLKKTLLDVERRRTEVKAQTVDGIVVNALWERIEDGQIGDDMGRLYIATTIQETGADGEASDVTVPLTTSELAESLKWENKAQSIRNVINSLALAVGKPPAKINVHGKAYRPIWFTVSHMEARLQDFVLDYQPGALAGKLKELQIKESATPEQPEQPKKGPLDNYGQDRLGE
jgi:hypothetical protein